MTKVNTLTADNLGQGMAEDTSRDVRGWREPGKERWRGIEDTMIPSYSSPRVPCLLPKSDSTC